ncbi:Haloacid dehalogenase-like hydrolase [Pestalotiopsis sp. NC0098]|nr:Haloacid dehalogenase-like hydrolase [Pestalotiopsis sp. NC0098]
MSNVLTQDVSEQCVDYRPVFLIQDPVRVFDTWKKAVQTYSERMEREGSDYGLDVQGEAGKLYNLVHAFMVALHYILGSPPPQTVSYLLYERFVRNPEKGREYICAHWSMPYWAGMLDSQRSSEAHENSSCQLDTPYHHLLSNDEKNDIEEQVGRHYLGLWHDDVQRLRTMLAEKTWFGFDLDDTLHEFRRSSGAATQRTLETISKRYGTPMSLLEGQYSAILKRRTANAFSDGKTSFGYRRQRFASLLDDFELPYSSGFLYQLLDTYESILKASLELKCGALELLSMLKRLGKKIVIITEGPQDAQERAVRDLGIAGFVDFLATTNRFGVSKVDGLFPRVLEHLGIFPSDMVYVGDNEQRDMKPAMAQGVMCVHLAEAEHIALDASPPRINTLRKLQYILLDENS